MGFRNPITSAAAVDTGGGRIPGVKVYSDQGNPGSGVVEWDAYTARVRGTLTSSQTGSGGSFFTLGMDGGPSVQLNVEAQPAGGYANAIRVSDPVADLVPKTAFPAGAYPNPTNFGPWGSTAYDDAYYQLDAGGYVNLGGLVKNKTAGGWAAGAAIVQLPAGCRPGRNHLVQALTQQSAYGEVVLQIDTLGNVNYISAVPGWSWVAGQFLTLDGIRFRAEQ